MNNNKKNTDDTFKQALFMLLDNNEYSSIGVNDICEKAGFSKQTFYRLYSGKKDFVQNIIQDEIDRYKQCVDTTYRKNGSFKSQNDIFELRLSIFRHIYKRKEYYHHLFKHSCFNDFRLGLIDFLKVNEKLPIFLFSNVHDYNLEYLNVVSTYFSYASIEFYVKSNFSYTPEAMSNLYFQTLKGLEFTTFNDLGLTFNNIKGK